MRRFAAQHPASSITGVSRFSLGASQVAQNWPLPQAREPITLPLTAGPLTLSHQGGGKPWATVSVFAAVPLREPLQAGYNIKRSLIPVKQATAGRWTRGDVVRVRIEVKATAGRTWVALRDPLPPGATVISSLGGQSAMLAERSEDISGAQPDYIEAKRDNMQAHYQWLPAGEHVMEYVVRLNDSGQFTLPATRVEAVYSPSVRGAWPNGKFTIANP